MTELTDIQRRVFSFIEEKFREGSISPTLREITEHFGWKSKRAAQDHVDALVRKQWLTRTPGKVRSLTVATGQFRHAVVHIPLFGSIPAGFGEHREEESDGCVSVDIATLGFKPTRNTFALRVKGDSMIGRHICDGDFVILEHGPEPLSGQIVAALLDRKSTLKTFVLKGGRAFLKAENPKYPNLIPSEELMIQGVFKALIRRSGD